MARTPKGADGKGTETDQGGTQLETNAGARDALMQSTFEELYALDCKIDDAIAVHVTELREERTKKRRQLRADLNMKDEDLKPLYMLFKRRKEIEGFDDSVAREKSLGDIREAAHALCVGGQLDFIAAAFQDLDRQDPPGAAAQPAGGKDPKTPPHLQKAGNGEAQTPLDAG